MHGIIKVKKLHKTSEKKGPQAICIEQSILGGYYRGVCGWGKHWWLCTRDTSELLLL